MKINHLFENSKLEEIIKEYPLAGTHVDGLLVRDQIPNTSSINGYYDNYKVLPGIREVSMEGWVANPDREFSNVKEKERVKNLSYQIQESGEINPLIVGVEKSGPYIIEGVHRLVALAYLKKKTFPALIVINTDDFDIE